MKDLWVWIVLALASLVTESQQGEMSCARPVVDQGRLKYIAKCLQAVGMGSVQLFRPGSDKPVAVCSILKRRCNFKAVDYDAVVDDYGRITLSFDNRLSRKEHSGNWTCSVKDHEGTAIHCTLQVFERPAPLQCKVGLFTDHILMACWTERIFPKGRCKWTYKLSDLTTIYPVSTREYHLERHVPFQQDGLQYFWSTCTVHLTHKVSKLRLGVTNLNLLIMPDITGDHVADTVAAFKTFTLSPPDTPVFYLYKKKIDTKYVTFEDREVIELRCRVLAGIPLVEKTLLRCQFSIGNHNQTVTESIGRTSSVLRLQVTHDHNDKRCFCWGLHLSGNRPNLALRFNVLYPSRVLEFEAQPSTKSGVNDQTPVVLTCNARGNPKPSVFIMSDLIADRGKIKELVQSTSKVRRRLVVTCRAMGTYLCKASNRYREKDFTSIRNLTLRVICPPLPCRPPKTEHLYFRGSLGSDVDAPLCVLGFPVPPLTGFELQKEIGGKFDLVQRENITMELIVRDDILVGVRVHYWNISQSDYGSYRLIYSRYGATADETKPVVDFHFLDTTDDSPSRSWTDMFTIHRTAIFGIIALGIAMVAVIIWVLIRVWRARHADAGGNENEEEGENEMGIEN